MHILLIVFGLLLILFGGGCTVVLGGMMVTDPGSFSSDFALMLSIWLPMGLAPLALGIWLFRVGLRKDREKRQAAKTATDATPPAKE